MDSSGISGSDLPSIMVVRCRSCSRLHSGNPDERSLKREQPSLTAISLECDDIAYENIANYVPLVLDANCVITECRSRDLFELGVMVQVSHSFDVKPLITHSNVCADFPLMSHSDVCVDSPFVSMVCPMDTEYTNHVSYVVDGVGNVLAVGIHLLCRLLGCFVSLMCLFLDRFI